MGLKRRVKDQANYWKALGATYKVIGGFIKKHPKILLRGTPEESRALAKAIEDVGKRYKLSKNEMSQVTRDAKEQIKKDGR